MVYNKDSFEVKYLMEKDPILANLILKIDSVSLGKGSPIWEQLVEMIIAQQLSSKVATVLWKRFIDKFPLPMNPNKILETPEEVLRSLGLSFQKIKYIRSIAETVQKDPHFIEHLQNLDNEKAIEQLTLIHGVGRWTAEMFLIFALHRLDVMSYGDLGLRTAVTKLFNKRSMVSEKTFRRLTKDWHPYESIAALYLWVGYERKLL